LRDRLKEATSGAILEAAEGVFGERGLYTAKMEEIASRAGVSVGTLYNHFKDRDALFASLKAERRRELLDRLDRTLAENDRKPFAEQLRAFLHALTMHLESHGRLLASIMESELCSPDGLSSKLLVADELYKRVEVLLARGLASRALRKDDSDIYSTMLMGMMRGTMVRRLLRSKPSDPPMSDQVDKLVRFFLEGAGA
jgi:AcrR family transcriptional regulator